MERVRKRGPGICIKACCSWILLLLLSVSCCQGLIEFRLIPRPQAAVIGQDVRLDCVATATSGDQLRYDWLFQGISVKTSVPKSSMFYNNSLYIPNIDTSHFGNYQCLVNIINSKKSAVSSQNATLVQAYIDEFSNHPQPKISIAEGNTSTLQCLSGLSAPPAQIHWLKNGRRITASSHQVSAGEASVGGAVKVRSSLTLEGKPGSEGSYRCVAVNPLTAQQISSNVAVVSVAYIPRAPYLTQSPPERIIVVSSVPVVLLCGYDGWPKPEVQWYKDGRPLETNTSGRVNATDDVLSFSEVKGEDVGGYSCNASNMLGSQVSTITQMVLASFDYKFLQEPVDVHALAGQSARLTCRPPASVPQASVHWYKDNQPITMRTGQFAVTAEAIGDLFFSDVQLEDEGEYFCVAVNDYVNPETRVSKAAKLFVLASPSFVQPPVPTNVIKNQLLYLTCKVKAVPLPRIQWYHSDQLIAASQRIVFRNNDQELLVSNVRKSDDGNYRCTATNIYGLISSPKVKVKVIVPPVIQRSVRHTIVIQGHQTLLVCSMYADPAPKLTWYKDGRVLSLSSRVYLSGQSLNFTDVQSSDAGNYSCEGANVAGRKTSHGMLTVYVAPEFRNPPKDQTVNVNQTVTLHCEAAGFPYPQLTWAFNNGPVQSNDFVMSADRKWLSVRPVSLLHAGKYTCSASNEAGSVSASAVLSVHVKATVLNLTGHRLVPRGDHVYMTCHVSGTPAPHVTWSHDNSQVTSTSDARIVFPAANSVLIRYATIADAGDYTCSASNVVGNDSKSVTVYIKVPPSPPAILSAKPMSTSSVLLSWQPANDSEVSRAAIFVIEYKKRLALDYVIYRADVAPSQRSVEVDGLRPATDYLFRIAASNAVGSGKYSAVLLATTFETAPSEPRHLVVVKVTAEKATLRWEMPESTNGDIRMYQLQYQKLRSLPSGFLQLDIQPASLPSQLFTLIKLRPFTAYLVRVRAATIHRQVALWGDFTQLVEFNTSISAPSRAPEYFSVSIGSATKATVTWKTVLPEYQNGPIMGHVVLYRPSGGQMVYQQLDVSVPSSSAELTGLRPNTRYQFHVIAYNRAGHSPMSIAVTAQTQQAAPSGYPRDLRLFALSPTDVAVTWKGVAASEQNSQLSGYVVGYNVRGSSLRRFVHVYQAAVMAVNISDLDPWTWYEVRVRAYTVRVANGYGPLSPIKMIRTQETVPGPITNLTVTPATFTAQLSWLPPQPPTGRILHYVVTYKSLLTVTDTLPSVSSAQPRVNGATNSMEPGFGNKEVQVKTLTANVTLVNLSAATTYRVSVVAVTGAGVGPVPVTQSFTTSEAVQQTTESVPGVVTEGYSDDVTELDEVNATLWEVAAVTDVQNYSMPRKDIPILVGALLTLTLLLIAIIVLLLIYCRRRKRKNADGVFFIPPKQRQHHNGRHDDGRYDPTDPQHADRIEVDVPPGGATADSGPCSVTTISSAGSPSQTTTPSTGQMMAPSVSQISAQYTGKAPASVMHKLASDYDVRFSTSYVSELPSSDIDIIPYADAEGIENPAYENGASSQYRHGDELPVYSDAYDTENTLRRNRMKKNAAAAIAIQRDRNTSVFQNDTDMLINNESEIIYDERTVL